MKKIALFFLFAVLLIAGYQCKPPAPDDTSFTFTVEEDTDFTGLPALQSFAFAEAPDYWLMFGGRTNGFHGFGGTQDFPFKMANKFIYVYNTKTHALDSMSTMLLPEALREQYTSTNMECRQVGKYVYVCGGYGEINVGQADSNWITHNIISRVDVQKMIDAVIKKDTLALAKSIAYDTSSLVAATGGELFKLADGKFYLVLGHNFTGLYSSSNFVQVYLDSVHVFKLEETDSTIKIQTPAQFISDNLNDSVTQFRRRDLVVAPHVMAGGNDYGLSIYAGVFTPAGNPFRYPIYLTGGNTPSYVLDTTYTQFSNVYSAPNLQMYDKSKDQMYTTIFGGLGDTLFVNADSAAFTKQILTINRDYKQKKTNNIYNASDIPGYVTSEGVFVRAAGAPVYKDNSLGIIDYHKIPTGDKQLMGYIYGGISSDSTQWNNQDTATVNGKMTYPKVNRTHASHKVYKVWIAKSKKK